ncbi:MAG: hypothetical protein AAFX55_14430 [Bacteroidota bacterium]
MHKAQKIVTGVALFTLLSSFIPNHAQQDNNAYFFVNEVIEATKKTSDTIYHLAKGMKGSKYYLEKYYNFRVKSRPFFTVFTIDSINDKIIIDSLRLKKDMIIWKNRFKAIDSIFSEEDIKQIIDIEMKSEEWDNTQEIFNKKHLTIEWCNYYCKNSISRPYYSENKDHCLILHKGGNRSPNIYLYKKEKENWILLEKIGF